MINLDYVFKCLIKKILFERKLDNLEVDQNNFLNKFHKFF